MVPVPWSFWPSGGSEKKSSYVMVGQADTFRKRMRQPRDAKGRGFHSKEGADINTQRGEGNVLTWGNESEMA